MPLMPWQQYVLDVGLELADDGGLFYSEVDLSAPRQNGKTAIVLAKLVHRANALGAFGGPQAILYTAQDRNYARKKWLEDHVKRLRAANRSFKEGRDYKVRLSNGSEAILWKNGSSHGICAPSDTAAHGDTLDEGVIDEAFAHEDDAVEQGMSPAMITRRNKQFFVLSTAGHSRSFYLWRKVLAGRRMIEAGAEAPVAYFEWGAPMDADPHDPKTWQMANPAFGMTISEHALAAEHARLLQRGGDGGLRQFRRAHLNQWVDEPVLEDATTKVFAPGVWETVVAADVPMPEHGLVFSVAVNQERSAACIGWASAGGTCGLVQDANRSARRSGVGWVIDELVRIAKPRGATVTVRSAEGGLLVALEQAGLKTHPVASNDARSSCGWFYDAVVERRVVVQRHVDLNNAVASATRKPSGDGHVWDPRVGEVAALIAVSDAAWVAASVAEPSFFVY